MSWLYTLTRLAAAVATTMIMSAPIAQTLESAVMPGPLIAGHSDLEGSCDNCHVRFERNAQPKLCQSCHKAVARDISDQTGYHGRLKDRECRRCHTDHKGRHAKIMLLDEARFDHTLTDFQLKGRHRRIACGTCHLSGKKYSQASVECVGCHRKDDSAKGHKNGLGPQCQNCHNEVSWKDASFDHSRTKFPLRSGHAEPRVKCGDCHPDNRFADISHECISCHRRDDMKDGHKGHFGIRCETCHDEREWKSVVFRHDRDTHFPLLDRHRLVKCVSCHRSPLYREKTPSKCIGCHRGIDNDKGHRGSLGERCDKCHTARGWRDSSFEHGRDTRYPLLDKHKNAKCSACHKDPSMREKLSPACYSCHAAEDRDKGHKGNYGEKCESCHNERGFKPSIFDHRRDTPFDLSGKHAKLLCAACHRSPLYRTKTANSCLACHEKEDVHFGSFGMQCDRCHVADDWRKVRAPDTIEPAGSAGGFLGRRRIP